jgi:hypothetical protein
MILFFQRAPAGRVARASVCSFLLPATIEERIPLLQYTATYGDEGAPRVGFTRGGFSDAESIEALLAMDANIRPRLQMEVNRTPTTESWSESF